MERVIIGTGSAAEAIYWVYKNRITCFGDDEQRGKTLFGLPVIGIDEAVERYRDNAEYLVAIPSAHHLLSRLPLGKESRVILAHEALAGSDYKKLFTIESSDSEYPDSEYSHTKFSFSKDARIASEEVEQCVNLHRHMGAGVYIRSVDIVVTERCSLRCRECSNLMQYYHKPRDYSAKELAEAVDALLDCVDILYELRIIGGEPLMNKEVYQLIDKLAQDERIRRLVIFTNGTIVPPPEAWPLMRGDKVVFRITDYGTLSRNLSRLEEALIREKIAYTTSRIEKWSPCASIERHGRAPAALEALFLGCCAKNLLTLLDGKLYHCPFMANAMNLGAVPPCSSDSLRLSYVQKLARDERIAVMRDFIFHKINFPTCDYCAGRPYGQGNLNPAEQAAAPLLFSPYPKRL